MKLVILPVIMMFACSSVAHAAESAPANQVVELTFTAKAEHADPFNAVELDVVFRSPGGKGAGVRAFWAGKDLWRVRYASPEAGQHRFKTICSVATDAGLHNAEGAVTVTPYAGDNPLYRHGP